MTAAVPDPRFRDQLAEEFGRHQGLRGPMDDERPDVWQNRCECGWDDGDERPGWRERYRQHIADALLPRVEARVQAAANQRAAESCPTCVREGGPYLCCRHCTDDPAAHENGQRNHHDLPCSICVSLGYVGTRAAALASPAPPPPDANGGEER